MYMAVDNSEKNCRIRIRFPDGFELEIEGNEEFVRAQQYELLSIRSAKNIERKTTTEIKDRDISDTLSRIIDYRDNIPFIKLKIPELDPKMAMLIIILAYEKLLDIKNVPALNIARSMRLSGYQPKRIDLLAVSLINDGSLLATGTKRTRHYTLTEKGKAKATVKLLNILDIDPTNPS